MKIEFIRNSYKRFFKLHEKEIMRAFKRCAANGDLTLRGDVWQFEKNFAKYVGTKYCATCNSGTDALFLSLKALGIGKGDEVISVSNTFIATLQAIVHCGAIPILADVGFDEQMDVDQVEAIITKKTKAIIPVHYTGDMVDMKKLVRIARKHKIHIVEDACQAVGSTQNGKKSGSFGILGCFSFNTAKLLGAYADGGAVCTNNRKLYETICLLRNHWNIHQLSVNRNDYPQPKEMQWAWKSRISNIQAAILNVKLKYINWILSRRREIALQYNAALEKIQSPHIDYPKDKEGRTWQEYHLRVKDREKFAKYLKNKGIETLVRDSVPNHKMKGLGLEKWHLPETERLAKEVIRLPLYPELSQKEVEYIIKSVKKFYDS